MRPDALRRTSDVNVDGFLRVSQAFLPLLRRATAGRIVNVSSTLGSLTGVTFPQTGTSLDANGRVEW